MSTGAAHPAAPSTGTDLDVVGRRALQFAVDAGVASAVAYVVAEIVGLLSFDPAYGGPNPAGVIATLVLTAVVWLGAFIVVPIANGDRTLGMTLFDLRVVAADGGRPGAGRHVVRFLLLAVDTLVAGVVALVTMLRSRDGRRVGDLVAGTRVVRASTG